MKKLLTLIAFALVAFTADAQEEIELSCPDDNHPHAIDLGIGIKFACCNVGATSPEGYGGYYAWGEMEEKNSYSLSNYQYGSYTQTGSYSFVQLGDISGTQYDVAYMKWGDSWRIPKSIDIQQLLKNEVKHSVAVYKGVNGLIFTGPNGNSIFLPFTGNKDHYNSNDYLNKSGNYWLSNQSDHANARLLGITNKNSTYTTTGYRSIGRSVRPVYIERKGLQSCPDDNHPHAIDLGLPSGTLWACCNVGATKPEEFGGYYAWGETEEKSYYDWNTYIHCDGSENNCHDIGDIAGTQYDAAHVKWGGSWVMPNRIDISELLTFCSYTWTSIEGVNGRLINSPNGGTIFLPAAGIKIQSNYIQIGEDGYYWLSHEGPMFSYLAWHYHINVLNYDNTDGNNRCSGLAVRPIISTTTNINLPESSSDSSNQAIYNLYGIKVADNAADMSTLPSGIYIVNGKKKVIK